MDRSLEHAALIAALIVERPLCLACIEAKTGLDRTQIDRYFARIRTIVTLRRIDGDRCPGCETVGRVYWLMQPPA